MKTKNLIIILISIAILTITACRKYPEGGIVNRVSSKIGNHGFYFKHYYVDGIDSVDYYFIKNEKNNYFEVSHIQFNTLDDGTPSQLYYYFFKRINDSLVYHFSYSGNWRLLNKQKSISLSFSLCINSPKGFDTTIIRGPMATRTEWDIMKLEDDDFFLETNYGGKHYRLELQR